MNGWRWLRAYYFEPSKDGLIIDGIWPAVQRIHRASPDASAYFQRDWMGGPNILLGLHTPAPDGDIEEAAASIRSYVTDHPSRTRLSADEISRRMKSLQLQEHKVGTPLTAPQPNNTVRLESGEPFSPFLVDDGLKRAVRTFLGRSARLVVPCLAMIRRGEGSREELCLQLMIVLAWLADPSQLRSHLSFSSHTQAFLRVQDRDGRLAGAFAARYAGAQGARVRTLLRETIDSLEGERALSPQLAEFRLLLRSTMSDIYEGLRSGRYKPVPARTLVGDPDRGRVSYARLIELLDSDPALRAWQITISLLYQVLNQLGLPAAERFLACYLLSRAAEDRSGQSAAQIRRTMDASGDHRDMFTFFTTFDAHDHDPHRAPSGSRPAPLGRDMDLEH